MSTKVSPKSKHRKNSRKSVHPLEISRIVLGHNQARLATGGTLVEVSESGFRLLVDRKDFQSSKFRSNLDLSDLVEEIIWIHLDDLDLVIEGTIKRTRFLGKGIFEVGVDYSDSAPDYWRECLVDLLPRPNELD